MVEKLAAQAVKTLTERGYSVGALSVRTDKGMVIAEDISEEDKSVYVDKFDNVNLEKAVHLTAYENVSDLSVVAHLFPKHLTALAASGHALYAVSLSDALGVGHKIPLCLNNTYQTAEFIKHYGMALTRDSGIYIGGANAGEIVERIDMAENAAKRLITAKALGEPKIPSAHAANAQFKIYKNKNYVSECDLPKDEYKKLFTNNYGAYAWKSDGLISYRDILTGDELQPGRKTEIKAYAALLLKVLNVCDCGAALYCSPPDALAAMSAGAAISAVYPYNCRGKNIKAIAAELAENKFCGIAGMGVIAVGNDIETAMDLALEVENKYSDYIREFTGTNGIDSESDEKAEKPKKRRKKAVNGGNDD